MQNIPHSRLAKLAIRASCTTMDWRWNLCVVFPPEGVTVATEGDRHVLRATTTPLRLKYDCKVDPEASNPEPRWAGPVRLQDRPKSLIWLP